MGPAIRFAELQDLPGAQPPEVLLEWKFVDGVLAVHQGGGFMAVLHPFADLERDRHASLPIWCQAEEQHVALPEVTYEARHAEHFRAYPPTVTYDRRYLFFSTPYAAFALDLYSLPGWTADGSRPDFRKLVDCSATPQVRIAAAPIPVSHKPYKVGVLLFRKDRGEYSWRVIELGGEQSGGGAPPGDGEKGLFTLPLVGTPCQYAWLGEHVIASVDEHVIALSTDQGHWVWRCRDAAEGNTGAMVRTWPQGDASGCLVLDPHVTDRQRFSWARQLVCLEDPDLGVQGFEWYYHSMRDAGPGARLEYYYVPLDRLQARFPTPAEVHPGGVPLGQTRPPKGQMRHVVILDPEHGGELYCCHGGLEQWRSLGILIDPYDCGILAVSFDDPLLVVLSGDPSHAGCHQITLCTSRQGERIGLGGLRLAADPLVWSRWLFTCERDGSNLVLFRREIAIA